MNDRRLAERKQSLEHVHTVPLTPDEEDALFILKEKLAEDGLYTPKRGELKESHDDADLLRFLRISQFEIARAKGMFAKRIAWEKEHDIKRLYANFPLDEFCNSQKLYAGWTGRRDRSGLPLYVFRMGALTREHLEEIAHTLPKRQYERFAVLLELVKQFIAPLCSHLPHSSAPTPVTAVTMIFDLADVPFRTMWTLQPQLQEAITIASEFYPETLGTIFLVNAPSFFSTVWGWVKGGLSKKTRQRIHILGPLWSTSARPGDSTEKTTLTTHENIADFGYPTAAQETLRALIDPENLPRRYGGTLEWDMFNEPILDAAAAELIGEMPCGPWTFVDGVVRRPVEYDGPGEKVWSGGRQDGHSEVGHNIGRKCDSVS